MIGSSFFRIAKSTLFLYLSEKSAPCSGQTSFGLRSSYPRTARNGRIRKILVLSSLVHRGATLVILFANEINTCRKSSVMVLPLSEGSNFSLNLSNLGFSGSPFAKSYQVWGLGAIKG